MSRKIFNKVGAGSLALVMAPVIGTVVEIPQVALADSNPAVADDTTDRKLTIHKFEQTSTNGKTEGKGELKDADSLSPDDKKPIKGVTFQIQRVKFTDGQTPSTDPKSNSYTLDPKFKEIDITTNAQGIATEDFGAGTQSDGVYLVTEKDDADVSQKSDAFFVQIPMTKRDGKLNTIKYDVDVFPKEPSSPWPLVISKSVNAYGTNADEAALQKGGVDGVKSGPSDDTDTVDTASRGGKVVWNLESAIPGATGTPGDITTGTKYTLTDALDSNLKYNGVSFDLGYINSKGQLGIVKDISTDLKTDYTAAVDSSNKLTVDFTPAGRKVLSTDVKAANDAAGSSDPWHGKSLFLVTNVDTSVSDTYSNGIIKNDFSLDYTSGGGHKYSTSTSNSDHPTVPGTSTAPNSHNLPTTPEIGLLDYKFIKESDENGNPLPGATFAIADTQANAKAGKYIKIDGNGRLYYPGDPNYGHSDQKDYTQISNTKGVVKFDGLRGVDVQTPDDVSGGFANKDFNKDYYTVEIKAPAGYELTKNATALNATYDDSNTGTIKDVLQTAFPLTGGHILLLVAFVVMASGTGYYIYQKSKKAKVEH